MSQKELFLKFLIDLEKLIKKYSKDISRNESEIEIFDPEETDDLKSFKGWRKVGRSVSKGQKSSRRSKNGTPLFKKNKPNLSIGPRKVGNTLKKIRGISFKE